MSAPALAPTGHSVVGMSVLDRRLGCPGSANAERGRPDVSSPAASRGTMLHEAAAKALYSGVQADDVLEDEEEGAAVVQAYLDIARAVHARLGGEMLVEHRFHLAAIHPELFGTSDCVIVSRPDLRTVASLDLKTGAGKAVEIRRKDGKPNLQLSGYGLGAILAAKSMRVDALELHVIQPLNGGHKHITLDALDIIEVAGEIQQIVERAMQPDAPRIAGDHCRWCKASADCPALRDAAFMAANVEFDAVVFDGTDALPAPSEMTPAMVGAVLRAADLMDLWIGAVRQHAHQEADRGRLPEGYKLAERKGRTVWKSEPDGIRRMFVQALKLPEAEVFNAPKPRTPKQVLDACKRAGVTPPAPGVWDDMTTVTNGGVRLVPVESAAPEVRRGADSDFAAHGAPEVDPLS